MTTDPLELRSRQGRITLVTVILGSGIALLDGTVVNVAIRAIGEDLDAGLGSLQWVVNGYLLSLASLILVGSSLGDRLGRRRIFLLGIGSFGAASLLCAFAQTPGQLIAFRVVQGVAGALLTPGALALIQGSYRHEDRPAAIGSWAGYTGIAAAVGPFVGGFLVENTSWRWIFAINVPLCLLVLWLGRNVPESHDEEEDRPFDVPGAVVGTVSLGLTTYVLTAWRDLATPLLVVLALLSVVGLVAFVLLQRRPTAMAPVALFASRVFSAANAMTFLTYAALGAVLFLLVLQLQVTAGYTPLEAGVATVPLTVCMLLFSSRAATVAARIGPRLPMTIGPTLCAGGVVWLSFLGDHGSYLVHVFPGILVFGVGLTTLVAPLTTAVLAAAPDHQAGIASGINNALARTGSLIAVAALPAIVGLDGQDYQSPGPLTDGYRTALWICGALLLVAAVVSWLGLDDELLEEPELDDLEEYLEDFSDFEDYEDPDPESMSR